MSVEVGFWRVDGDQRKIHFTPMPDERRLEDIITRDLDVVDPNLLLIGRQVSTAFGTLIDLLALDADGNLVVIELKRAKTPREVIAQLLDYGSWVRTLEDDDIARIFADHQRRYSPGREELSLDDAFKARFNVPDLPEELNESHRLVLVAGELDAASERIVTYLNEEHGVAINAVFFRFFRDGDAEYLSRAWLLDPSETSQVARETRGEGPWNGEYYVSFGEGPRRSWQDAMRHGFISAGGGAWYTNTLRQLAPGDRIWVNVPGRGYVGVGKVTETATSITEFTLPDAEGVSRPVTEVVSTAPDPSESEDELEHYVRVQWLHTVPLGHAVREKGFFGNQNTVARPRTSKWPHTVERLKVRFGLQRDETKEPGTHVNKPRQPETGL